ncbi:PREDICTED: zinc finger CCHC domain-containing protein 8 homolog [Polistes dominula]|uniref:Zinc finger CCHC domain-containing protein 8 homolog n=1 Tax=Polistes dominula TaxID=743375 RepID=A0ABM1JF36_POLDO|nr:PREDICTED: zinc finger CCHC domain-containing protein 8 homolog [Polistes dominula]
MCKINQIMISPIQVWNMDVQEYIESKSNESVSDEEPVIIEKNQPLVKVIFQNETIARKFRHEITASIEALINSKNVNLCSNYSNLILEFWDKPKECEVIEINTESDNSKDLFTLDTQPLIWQNNDVPTYDTSYKLFDENGKRKEDNINTGEETNVCSRKLSCFNCSGNHNLNDCVLPWNHANITKNRNIKLSDKKSHKGIRYHLDDGQRFGHLIPGQISKDLRNALGLRDNELPLHIYRMRALGYPPGWLEEARLQHSGLSLFNSDGAPELDPDEEPGEVIILEDKVQYDVNKIVDFPGFNVSPPSGTRDEYMHAWTRELQYAHSKENMLLYMGDKKTAGYKRKKLKLNTSTTSNSSIVSSDMEIEDLSGVETIVETVPINGHFIPPLPKSPPTKPPEPQSSSSTLEQCSFDSQSQDSIDGSVSPLSRTNSPSLSDLESIKKRLLVELEDSSSQSNLETPVKCNSLNSTSKSEPPSPSIENTPQSDLSQNMHNSLNSSQGSIKSIDLGTPIVQRSSPFNKLPSSDKFSKNICDVINFENLPDSTGKYEQMSEVLQKVRSTMAKINSDL